MTGMKIDIEIILIGVFLLIFADIILFLRLFINKGKEELKREKEKKTQERFLSDWVNEKQSQNQKNMQRGEAFIKQTVIYKAEEKKAEKTEKASSGISGSFHGLYSALRMHRIKAAVELGTVGTEQARVALEQALQKEKDFPVRLYIANSLTDIGDEASIPVLLESLLGAHRWYRTKVNMLIAEFGSKLESHLPHMLCREEIEIKELLVDISSVYITGSLKEYLFKLIDTLEEEKEKLLHFSGGCTDKNCCGNCSWGRKILPDGNRLCKWNGPVKSDFYCRKYKMLFVGIDVVKNYEKLAEKAAEAAAVYYFKEITAERYLYHKNEAIRNTAVTALGNVDAEESFLTLKTLLADEAVSESALHALAALIDKDPRYIRMTVDAFRQEEDAGVKEQLAEALSGRIEYFIMKLFSYEKKEAAEIIKQLIALGKTSELIGFLNKNKDIEMENELLAIVKDAACGKEQIEKDFCTYLKERLLPKAGLIKCERLRAQKEKKRDPSFIKVLYLLLAVTLVFFPIIYLLMNLANVFIWPPLLHLKLYVIDYNYFLIFYSMIINCIYLILMLFSRINVSKQAKLWGYKNMQMLFRRRMLPGVSIIAPAYNEEKVIIESANSLLNLKYPDYELIFVNDGSTDDTLNVLIDYFDLKRIDSHYEKKLNTEPIRGIYANPSFPKLMVVDKENGGKADSLNAGIVVSRKEYFCCIDSDSLLEDEALLKLASQTLDEGTETPALGGNVFPINGCTVQRGYISKIRIPDNYLARFQTIEYIRAFMAGRLGWAYVNGLLIISGAFGLFRKERVIDVGGYLTSNEKYKKDTVGEDMELVVRIAALMREKGLKYKINYCYNANCWTEVPEELAPLKRQRYRWHRGLIEILHFHRRTLFNPKYGKMGMLSMPYFFIFEMVGPLIEIQGYLMIVAALLLGILNWEIALMLFGASILLGVLVSIASLEIAEKDNNYFNYGDVMKLVSCAVIENFGVRQLFSFWRVIGYLKMFSKTQSWGSQVRKGFAVK